MHHLSTLLNVSHSFVTAPRAFGLALEDPWGLFWRVWDFINREYRFGKITVSIASLVQGLIIVIVAVIVARTVSALISRRIVKRANIDPGIAYTVARLTHYAAIVIGALYFFKVAFDVDLTSVAVIFTALSVGIGFGLQYIAHDIASGFILLFERPARVGDRITIGQDEGDVQSINLRTTIVMTNDRIAVIVPNSKLVSDRLINWSYGDPRVRLSIPVGVAYGSDVDLVTRTLTSAAKGVENVLSEPRPSVQFLNFGDSSLDFRLLVWTNQPRRHPQIKSDINYRIEKLFREEGIEIPFPQREFRLRGVSADGQTQGEQDDNLQVTDRKAEAAGERASGKG